MTKGNLNYESYYDKLKSAPTSLIESIKIFEKSDFCKKLLGDKLYETILTIAKNEWSQYNNYITNFEIGRYLDLV